jgi:F-type H+-transporting ATPase subunit delta
MHSPRLAARYAKSVIDLSIERSELETVYADMQYLQQLTKGSRDLVNMLRSPVVPATKKQAVMEAIVGGKVSTLTISFINLLITKGREGELPEVINAFIKQYKEKKGIHIVKLTTATPISDALKTQIVNQVKQTSDMQTIELETIVNPDIIGGFVLQTGDKLVDASISYDLREISKQFENNDFIYKVR